MNVIIDFALVLMYHVFYIVHNVYTFYVIWTGRSKNKRFVIVILLKLSLSSNFFLLTTVDALGELEHVSIHMWQLYIHV